MASPPTGSRLEAVELRRVRMPLTAPFRASHGTEVVRDVLLLRATTSAGEGWGECGAPAEPLSTSEYVEGCAHVLRRHLLPRLFAATRLTAAAVAGLLRPVQGHRMAKAAIEMALLTPSSGPAAGRWPPIWARCGRRSTAACRSACRRAWAACWTWSRATSPRATGGSS